MRFRNRLDSSVTVACAQNILVACILAGFLLAAPVAASGQVVSGKLTGVVTDAQTGEPVAGARVNLEGTGLGSVSSENGRYYLLNVPPGSHSVVAELIGYQTLRVENVLVVINATRTLDLPLTPRPIAVDEIGVKAEATPWVDVRRRGSTDLITDQQLQNLPVYTVEEALELKPGYFTVPDNENILAYNEKWRGITSVRVRGGRNGETSTLIDGIPVDNFVFGGPGLSLTKAAVSQVTFRKGGLPAQYGNALSGVVDIATKEPSSNLAGGFEYQTSKLAGALGSTPDELNDFDFLEGYLSGAIPETDDRLRFLLAGRKQSGATRVLEFDDEVLDPSGPPVDPRSPPNQWDVFAGWRAFGFDDEQQIYAKLQYLFTPNTKFNVSYVGQSRQYQRYDSGFLLTYDDPLESPIIDTPMDTLAIQRLDEKDVVLGSLQEKRQLYVGALNHVIGRTFLSINAGVFKQRRLNCNFFQGVCLADNFASVSWTDGSFVSSGYTRDHPTAGTDLFYGGEDIATYLLRADVQSQV
ncbi:MAG: TonB-dependent receptor, partial [Gemmatimonadales bacterium]